MCPFLYNLFLKGLIIDYYIKTKVNQFFAGVYRSMFPSELLTANKKIMHVYESFCTPLCRKYQLNQSDLDLILFIANNPI